MEVKGHSYDEVQKIKEFLFNKTALRPSIGVVCGSGLGGLVNNVESKESFAYEEIPGFPVSTVAGHAGKLVFGTISGKAVVCLQGRFHLYEGHTIHKSTLPIRVLASLGIKTLIVTNAAGGVNPDFNVGDIMIIHDHIGFPMMAGQHPLVGHNDERFGPRFPSMTAAYNHDYRQLVAAISKDLGYGDFTRAGVYCMLSGPTYETPAEIRLVKAMGGDAVGMSTVAEVQVAVHMGLKVMGLSLITNKCISDSEIVEGPNHAEVLEVGKQRAECVLNIVTKFIGKI